MDVIGTTGYAAAADALARQYEGVTFDWVHRDVLHLFPRSPSRVLDLGAGTGRDAAALCRLGHSVVAIEPIAQLRAHGQRIHRAEPIEWVEDTLPDLDVMRGRSDHFDLVLLIGVWMHLDKRQRRDAMATLTGLLAESGRIIMSVRHGPTPEGRRMFSVSATETAQLAGLFGMHVIHRSEQDDRLNRPDVGWSILAFERNGISGSQP